MTSEEFSKAYSGNFVRTQRFLMHRGMGVARAEEFAQAAWSKAWERRAQLRDRENISGWVQMIAWNLWRSELRSAPLYTTLDEQVGPAHSSIERRMDAARALKALDVEDRRLMLLHVVGGMTSAEIALASNRSAVGVRVRLHRATAKLRKERASRRGRLKGLGVVRAGAAG